MPNTNLLDWRKMELSLVEWSGVEWDVMVLNTGKECGVVWCGVVWCAAGDCLMCRGMA